ncbi:MAG: hypothetical protein E7543_00415 [Ruminococcaceae bacterium]|nr:hypothetical protein [Oscillospiraceae bacterium]
MSAKCPNCGRPLKWYNIKADCPDCKISIPNYNWEERLEQDNILAEAKFAKLYNTLNKLGYSVYGTKLRIARIIMSFIPIIGIILPWASVKGDDTALNFDLLGIFTDGTNTIKFFGPLFKNIGSVIETMSAEGFSGPVSFTVIGLLCVLLSIVVLVIAFFLIFITFRRPKTNIIWIFDFIGIALMGTGAGLFCSVSSKIGAEPFTVADLTFVNAQASVGWGIFVFLALDLVAFTGNLLVSRADVKSDEQLEAERLERVRIKEEKEEQERIKKEAARAEALEREKQEQAEKVRKAREALAKENKN